MRQLDLDTPGNIDTFVALFYEKIVEDEKLSPIFLNHANFSIATHLPVVSLYWQKMLLGTKDYTNNTMKIHRDIQASQPFQEVHYERWLYHFNNTLTEKFNGVYCDRALSIAKNVIKNMNAA